MNEQTAADLWERLNDDPDRQGKVERETDRRLSIGQDVWRLRWRNQHTTAVTADADLSTTCGALLDALALLEDDDPRGDSGIDRSGVNVLIDRPLPGPTPSETDQAIRSLKAAVVGVTVRICYRSAAQGWSEDVTDPPCWPAGHRRVRGWVDRLMVPRLTAAPSALAVGLVEAVNDVSLHLYPSEITSSHLDRWAVRIDGLEIGVVGADTGVLTIGRPGAAGDGPQRSTFISVFGQPSVKVARGTPLDGHLTVAEAASRIRALIREFRDTDVPGAPVTHRTNGGGRIVDEHTLEARLLKGLIRVDDWTGPICGDVTVARGSQFPTLWATRNGDHPARARYLDALLCRGRTPVAVELKVATNGQGRYYRRAIVQAALYRHYIVNADDLDPWFAAVGLDRADTRAAIAVPVPARWTSRFDADLELLRRIGHRVGVEVHLLDDRATPEYDITDRYPDIGNVDTHRLSWKLAAAISKTWPRALGRVVERHDCGGFYDQLQLQAINDRRLSLPHVQPRLSLNRPGSVWVFNQLGHPRWVWRGIWEHLAVGGDIIAAARTIGTIAGAGQPEPAAASATFAEMAAHFLDLIDDPGWTWTNAWPDTGDTAPWIAPYTAVLHRLLAPPTSGVLPRIADIWGATYAGEDVPLIIDARNGRTWIRQHDTLTEITAPDPLDRIAAAVQKLTG